MSSDEKSARELFAPREPITNTRDRIIAAALELFYASGFHAVGLDQVLREVGVTKTTFYNHFESKDELILAAIAMRDRWEARSFGQAVEAFTDGSPRGTILAFFDVLDRWFADEDYAGCLFITACAEFPAHGHPAHRAAAEHYRTATGALQQLCVEAGADDAGELAKRLELLIEGAVVMRMINGDDTTARSARAVAAQLLDAHCAS